jgi:uncharacterized protein YkwD
MSGGMTGGILRGCGNWPGKPDILFYPAGNPPHTTMPPRFCPKCGSALEFSVQKFCTTCGATLPDMPAASTLPVSSPGSAGIPIWIIAAVGLVLLIVAGFVLIPYMGHAFGNDSAGSGGNSGNEIAIQPTPSGTALLTTVPLTPAISTVTAGVTTTGTPVFTPSRTSIPTTQVPTPTPIASPTSLTTVPTPTPFPEQTSIIARAVTYAPSQPPSSSYTSGTPGAPYIEPGALEARVHELINVQRQQNGLSSLNYDPFLADIARGHSWDMVSRTFFEHVNPDGLNPRARGDVAGYPCIRVMGTTTYEGIAENLFQGNRYSGYYTNAEGTVTSYDWDSLENISQVTVNGWMNSPGHRQNILTPHFSYEGIGVAFSSDDKIYITENFC